MNAYTKDYRDGSTLKNKEIKKLLPTNAYQTQNVPKE